MRMSDLSSLQPPYAIFKHSCEHVPSDFPYLRPTCHSGEPFRMRFSVFKMQSSLTVFISSSFLAQLVIPAYGATWKEPIKACDNSDDWIRPSWPANIMDYCQRVLNELEETEPEVHQLTGPLHEFLPVGMAQKPRGGETLVPVRTPWKLVNGALISSTPYYSIFRSNVGRCFRPMYPSRNTT